MVAGGFQLGNGRIHPGHGLLGARSMDAPGGANGKLGILDDALAAAVEAGAQPVDTGVQGTVGAAPVD